MNKFFAFGVLLGLAATALGESRGVHLVAKGDSLYGISNRYHVSVNELIAHNRLHGNEIKVGQRLYIPAKGAVPVKAVAHTTQATRHRVSRGQTLSGIARRYNVSVASLRSANGLRGSVIRPGQNLVIPGKYMAAPAPVVAQARHSAPSSSAMTGNLQVESGSALVVDASSGQVIYSKNAQQVRPIASITKLMTAMVVLDAKLPMSETISIGEGDVDHLKNTTSRMPIGARMTRKEMMRLALMSSENRAASALSRHYPGGKSAFIKAMNAKAASLGMKNTRFADATGLTPRNVSTAEDLVKLLAAASQYEVIHQFTTTEGWQQKMWSNGSPLAYMNSNYLVRAGKWDIDISKTGYINEAGRCLVMKANVANRPAYMVFLRGVNKYAPMADADRIRHWLEAGGANRRLASR